MADATTGLLYDRVVPFANLPAFNSRRNPNVDTIDASIFLQGYFELYNAAIVPTGRPPYTVNELRNMTTKDTNLVNIGIIHYRYNVIDSGVAVQKLYFDEDSVLREDKSIEASLFVEDTIFLASPLVDRVEKGMLYYKVAGSNLFNNTGDEIEKITIDFDDGRGFRNVHVDEIISVNYPDTGTHTLHFRIYLPNNRVYDAYSKIVCFQKTANEIPYPKDIIPIRAKIPFMDYEGDTSLCATGKMYICYAHSDKLLRKPLIISDGFDPQNTRGFESGEDGKESLWNMLAYNNKHLGDSLISVYGYDIVFVDYDDGGEYIERNAMVFVAAIDTLNKMLRQNQSQEQIIVVGPSMGGPVTHYALSYIEKNPSATTNFGNHNCRLWIAFDSPQQGANINLGAQAFMYFFGSVGNNEEALYVWDNVINCPAAKQMLKHQFNIYAPVQPFQTCSLTINQYVPHPYFTHFYQAIESLEYPINCRNLSIVNGSLNSITFGSGCSEAIELDAKYNIRVSKIQLFPTSGVCEVFYGMYTPGDMGYLIGNRNKFWLFAPSNNNFSIDAAPGGAFNTFQMIQDAAQTNPQIKQITMSRSSHCFMPITSTLDISGNMNYNTDLSSLNLVEEGLTPFDSYAGVMDSNMYHATLNQNMVDYLINEFETYLQGPREVQLCSRPTYTLHLPQDSVATVTWQSSDNIRLITGNNPYEVTIVPLSTVDGWVSAEVSTLKHRKQLAHYPIHVFQDDFPLIDTVSNATDTLYVNTTMLLGDTFCVNCGKTVIVTDTLHCAPSARLIVRPGGKLIVDGGTLTNSCTDEMWQGIFVEGHSNLHQTSANQGTVVLRNGAVIENALCGIRTGLIDIQDSLIIDFNNTGGIVTAENSTFHNCAKAVAYFAYIDTFPNGTVKDNLGIFTNCTFTVDDNNYFAANNTAFSDHVFLWAVKGVKFYGCTFNNLTSGTTDRRHAINAHSAGFAVDIRCTSYMPSLGDCNCPANFSDSCIFLGFSTAIEANTDGAPYAVTVNRAQFADNGTAVRIAANNFATVTECDFNLQSVPAGWQEITGLYLDNCTGYLVEGNSFRKATYTQPTTLSSTGIYVKKSGTAKNSLHRNGFTNLNYGVYVKNNNGDSQSGLQLTCNDFYGNNYDIYLPYKGTLKGSQGNLFKGADNTFSGTRTSSIYNYGTQQLTYYYSRGSSHAPYNVSSTTVTLNSGATANDCASTLCGDELPQPLTNLVSFTTLMSAYTPTIPSPAATEPQTSTDGIAAAGSPTTDDASAIYHNAVRALMADTLLDLAALELWHAAAQPIADPYSLTETRFAMGYDEDYANNNSQTHDTTFVQTHGRASLSMTDEFSDYTRFHNLKRELREADENAINWYALTPAQIAQLQDLAENGTCRSSVMARGVLCFFFNICYDDEDFSPTGDIRRLASTGETGDSSHNSDVSMKIYPNPATNTLHVEFEGTDDPQGTLTVTDITGVVVLTQECHNPVTQLDVSNLTPGLYVVSFRNVQGVVVRKFVKL